MFSETRENFSDVKFMGGFVLGEDKDVIQVSHYVDVEEIPEDIVNEVLKTSRSVGKAESHDKRFKLAITSRESSFPLVSLSNPDIVISPANV